MSRVLPQDNTARVYTHYPIGDVVNGKHGSRYFYHSHPPEDRSAEEHGHFHLFLDRRAFGKDTEPLIPAPPVAAGGKRADVVHLAALAIGYDGLPLRWFGTNRWVTDEWLYPATDVIGALSKFDLRGSNGDPKVNDWLTAILRLSAKSVAGVLIERDEALRQRDMSGEDRTVEVTSMRDVDLAKLLA
jgi:hypothetical protein